MRPTNLQQFNHTFPPQGSGRRASDGSLPSAPANESALRRELPAKGISTIEDFQTVLSKISISNLATNAPLLLALVRDLPITLKHEPAVMERCAAYCLKASTQTSLATQESIWLSLRNALPGLPQATAIALSNAMQTHSQHMPASVV